MWLKRIGYYLVGLSIGSVAVYFFWTKKNASFDYGMDARTLKSIRVKKRLFSPEAQSLIDASKIDTLTISYILKTGDVDFSKSDQRKKPCGEYYIQGKDSLQNIALYISRCDSTATVNKIYLK